MATSLPPLPIDAVLPRLLAALRSERAAVLQAPPGAGKTTRVPLALRDAGLHGGSQGQIVLLEPRRVAARAAAGTLARNLGQRVGETVGFKVRFEEKVSRQTEILVMTEGILTRRFANDPFLEGTSIVLLDEFHERSIHTDLALAFLRELLDVRDDLRVVVMSATLDATAVSSFLGNCPVITSDGRPYPVRVRHSEKRDDRPLQDRMAGAVKDLVAEADDDGGDILCFLPGVAEIRRLLERLQNSALPGSIDVVPLYGALSPAEQDRAIQRGNRRKIILATNVAETSLTIEGVSAVVDSGLAKVNHWDPRTDEESLDLVRISQASAEQRAGRAGRTRPGRCVRLWTQTEHTALPTSHAPEIARVDLTGPLLDVIAFHPGDPQAFPFFEMPPKSALQRSSALLRMLSAVDDGWQLTKTGEALARLPLSPRAGRVLLAAAARGVLEEAALAVALLEDDRTFERGDAATRTDSDIGEQVARFEALLDHGQLRGPLVEAKRARDDLLRAARDLPQGPLAATRARALKAALLAGFPDRLCRRRRSGEADAVMVGGRGVRLARESGVLDAGLFLALHLTGGPGNSSLVRVAEAVDLDLLREVLPEQLSTSDEAVFDEDRGAFVGVRRTRFWDLVIEERSGVPVDPAAVAQSLAHAFSERFERLFRPDDDAVRLRDRIRFAAFALADADGWPDVSNAAIQAWLPELCEGKRTLDDVARINWQQVFEEKLSWQQRRLLDEVVPDRIEVPTGNHIRVDYGPALTEGGAPILAVRLQELFGLLDTPRVARGRIVVVLHLLSPGYKPVQVTKDLRSFWQNGYPEVKRELRARYPRHSWPEDPLTAEPTARARRRP